MEAARVHDEATQARANDETVLLTRQAAGLAGIDSRDSANLPAAIQDQKGFGEEVVVVSTYDGEWHPTDRSKP